LEGQELAARHIALRERAGLTQEQEAKMAGISPTTISGIESGKIARPHLKTLLKIARALGVDVGELRESDLGKGEALPSQEKLFPNGDPEKERRSKLAELESFVRYATGRADYWEQEFERVRAEEGLTAESAYRLALLAIQEFMGITAWLFEEGPAAPLWRAMQQGVGLEIEEEYEALINGLIERTTQAQRKLLAYAEHLAETEDRRNEIAAKRREAEAALSANVRTA
jgi:transcriptional regulator with XRE-family HTH domain